MGLRLRRRVKIAPGISVNLSKSGASASVGRRGAAVNVGKRGAKATVGLPGTGVSYSENLTKSSGKRFGNASSVVGIALLVLVVVLALHGIFGA